ncbi:TIGR03086 family metal-binding protein [Qaidamihabitans albus]|uniref:TIGR03086 family metal-binding protein n=1 Tax=Qaidamihabitans albus TaxID=2795733 RepID=UPI0018F21D6E|nr:TIGR03086 family metal-binding protein [Qaidamihabitans albus]
MSSPAGFALLERAINYTLGSLRAVPPGALGRPTPCRDWDLGALLAHLNDSLYALQEAADDGSVDLDVRIADPGADPVATVRDRARVLLGAWAGARDAGVISIAGSPLASAVVGCAGALEVAVHGWDVARACGQHRPIPTPLAEEMLELAALLVGDADRPSRFAASVELPEPACPGDRLIAFLGRHPG